MCSATARAALAVPPEIALETLDRELLHRYFATGLATFRRSSAIYLRTYGAPEVSLEAQTAAPEYAAEQR